MNKLSSGKESSENCKAISVNDEIIECKETIVEKMNEYYVNISQELANVIPKCSNEEKNLIETMNHNDSQNSSNFFLAPVTYNEILKILMGMKESETTVYNNPSNKLIKYCAMSLCKPIADMVNLSFKEGTVPDIIKIFRVIPIFKKGDKLDRGNYRPISTQSPLAKVIEICFKDRLLNFLDSRNYFYPKQYGFRKKSSTLSATMDILTRLQKQLDQSMLASGLFIDLKKAFDTVDHKLLIHKMERSGIRGKPLEWIMSYLSDRKQYVVIDNVMSSLLEISCGVPQGSVLGPTLYLIYVNDLKNMNLYGSLYLFADDTGIFYKGESRQEIAKQMQKDLSTLATWFKFNKLTVNVEKTMYIFFSKKDYGNNTIDLFHDGKKITESNTTVYLGLTIGNKLSWENHINVIRRKIAPVIGQFHRIKNLIPDHLKRQLYFANIHSHLMYLIQIWSSCSPSLFNSVYILQKKALKALFNLDIRFPSDQLYLFTKVLPLQNYVKIANANIIYKIRNNLILHDIELVSYEQIHDYQTRGKNKLVIKKPSSSKYGLQSILYKAINDFNSLPENIRQSASLEIFKKRSQVHFSI